ncbi:hypothetical protein HWV62_21326 [Athelia sp. TMB]|nr:hypothetical protein HWV62_21326 [Athelia sp. TMB]
MASAQPEIAFTLEKAQQIISEYHSDIGDTSSTQITSFAEERDQGYSQTRTRKTYHIELANASYMLAVSLPESGTSDYHPNNLATVKHLHDLIQSQTSIPLPAILKSGTVQSSEYLLLSSPPASHSTTLATARRSGLLTPESDARIQLTIGTHLRQLHAVQNDWFGLPSVRAPADASYVWQESFTLFLEAVLMALEARGVDIGAPYGALRGYLSRAIGFYLFDDAEVPSLVGFTVSEEDVVISTGNAEPEILSYPLPWHALWGDPMMEAFFIPPGPSKALLEGYMAGEAGGPLMPFARQRTKRLWYTLFTAGVVLLNAPTDQADGKLKWAEDAITACVRELKDAPCY